MWHAWSSQMPAALARASVALGDTSLLKPAIADSVSFTTTLLTEGGPFSPANPTAGGTDILISYTWKLAFAAGKGADYGLASAVAIVIFFIVAAISTIGFARTRVLENVA